MATPQQALAILLAAPAGVIAAANLAAGAGCGIGSSLSQVSSTVRNAVNAINQEINNSANNLIASVQNLPNQIATQASSVVSSTLTNILGPIRPTTNSLQQEVQVLLLLVNDPIGFAAHYDRISQPPPEGYGNTAIIRTINSITQGTSFCQATGQQPGGQHQASANTAAPGPPRTPVPTANTTQAVLPNSGATAQNNAP
jgi:hypothetical protein